MSTGRGTITRTVRIGLTGPIGCGKSTIAHWLAELGVVVIDADALSRDVTAPGEPGLTAVVERFGPQFLRRDGSLDRAALGRLVFGDPAALVDLERIIHPAVRKRLLAAVAAAETARAPAVTIEAIKLVEGGLAADCDEVWLVCCSAEEQRARLIGRGMPAADVEQRLHAQGEIVARLAPAAARILDTTGDPASIRPRVAEALAMAIEAHGREPRRGSNGRSV